VGHEPLSVHEYTTGLVQAALAAADNPDVPVSVVARQALRVAKLRNDWEAQWWLTLELATVSDDKDWKGNAIAKRMSAEVAAHMTPDEHRAIGYRVAERWIHGPRAVTGGFQPRGISDLEQYVTGLESQIEGLKPPDGLHPVDLYQRSQELLEVTTKLRAWQTEAKSVLARQRGEIADYLPETERQILFGQVNSDVFERNRAYVDERLAALAPQALEQFEAAYRRHSEGDAEARSDALTSCRRVLKTLADVLYPATDETVTGIDGVERKMTDDKFIMRLCQFAAEKTEGSASRELLVSQIGALGERLDALDRLTSKGVHGDVSAAEVDQCLIQTYLAAGDLLRLADGRSAVLPEELDA
jgi:hypothetical protein